MKWNQLIALRSDKQSNFNWKEYLINSIWQVFNLRERTIELDCLTRFGRKWRNDQRFSFPRDRSSVEMIFHKWAHRSFSSDYVSIVIIGWSLPRSPCDLDIMNNVDVQSICRSSGEIIKIHRDQCGCLDIIALIHRSIYVCNVDEGQNVDRHKCLCCCCYSQHYVRSNKGSIMKQL